MASTNSVATTGGFSQLISRDFSKVLFDEFIRTPEEYKAIANVETLDGAYLHEGQMTGFGAMQQIGEGQPVPYENWTQGNEKTIYPKDFALAFAVTENLWEDDRKGHVKKAFAELGKAAAYTRDLLFWDLLNSGFVTTTRTGIDGAALFATHTLFGPGGSTYSNVAAVAGGLNVTSLQTALNAFENNVNENGVPAPLKPKMLIVPYTQRFEAETLIKSEYNPENAMSQVNTVGNKGLSFMVGHYLTSQDAWFLVGDKRDHDLRFVIRKPLQLKSTDDFDTRTAKFRAVMRVVPTFVNYRGVYGNAGV
jgi:phage major head subunit gpT-like protein